MDYIKHIYITKAEILNSSYTDIAQYTLHKIAR